MSCSPTFTPGGVKYRLHINDAKKKMSMSEDDWSLSHNEQPAGGRVVFTFCSFLELG